MTIERPDAQIIQFSPALASKKKQKRVEDRVNALLADGIDPRRKRDTWDSYLEMKKAKRKARLVEAMAAPEGLTETCVNSRLRELRKEAWSKASKLTNFLHARMKWYQELSSAQYWDVPGADEFPPLERSWNHDDVKEWRVALVEQLLTSAPTMGDVTWKQAQLRSGQHRHIGVDDEAIERAIAADLAWLKDHPARKSQTPMSEERKAERREFKEAMRQRIRDIAASRDIPDDEIRPVLSLRHHLIADFAENYGVNFEWLLEGKGRIFKKDPITLNPNMTGSEFAAVVRTLPAGDQRAIEAKIREIVEDRQP